VSTECGQLAYWNPVLSSAQHTHT